MNTDTLTTPEAEAERLRNALVDKIQADGHARTPAVETALRTVPRHRFVPEAPLTDAYRKKEESLSWCTREVSASARSTPCRLDLCKRQHGAQVWASIGQPGRQPGKQAKKQPVGQPVAENAAAVGDADRRTQDCAVPAWMGMSTGTGIGQLVAVHHRLSAITFSAGPSSGRASRVTSNSTISGPPYGPYPAP
ncbi:hypothetical protein [Streptomyces aureus]|uniref:Transposase n=1 Tax=Streptomyces aureus TaxID=193461 RepID=A0ABV4SUL5_9ACTN